MKLISLKIQWFKNLDIDLDFTQSEGISVFVGNNGSGKSNILEAISAIFYGLYDETLERRCNFTYELDYIKDGKNIKIIQFFFRSKEEVRSSGKIPDHVIDELSGTEEELRFTSHYIDGEFQRYLDQAILPDQIIALYSWEEMRLYKEYYKVGYDNCIDDLIKYGVAFPKMSFISKDHWNIAILVLIVSWYDISSIIWDFQLEEIIFDCNTEIIDKFFKSKPESVINAFAKVISNKPNLTLDEFKNTHTDTHEILYNRLIWSLLHKEQKNRLFNKLELKFNINLEAWNLSEWQKKQVLIYFVINILTTPNSIVLLDEPDSYIHVGSKERLKNFMSDFLDITHEWEFIMTTHSPTLMNKFDKKHIFYLEFGKLKGKDKAEILKEIAGDAMSYTEQQIVLNTTKDIIIVEWKTDETYIQTALGKLKEANSEYKDLDFEFLLMWWSDFEILQRFSDKFPAKPWQKIMAFFDRDQSWLNCIKNALWEQNLDKESFSWKRLKDIYINFYPKKLWFTQSNFEVEDYFKIETCRDFLFPQLEAFSNLKQWFKKQDFAEKCKDFDKSEFEWFKVLFDLILSIDH